MGKAVLGKNVDLIVNGQGIACGKSCTMNTVTDMLPTTSRGTGEWNTFKPGGSSWTVGISGLVYIAESGKLATPDLYALKAARQAVGISYERVNNLGAYWRQEGAAFINSISDTGSVGEYATFEMQLQGSGELRSYFTPSPNPTNGKIMYVYLNMVPGNNSVTAPIGLFEGLHVFYDGQHFEPVTTLPDPLRKEFRYDASTGLLETSFIYDAAVPQPIFYYQPI